MKLSDWLVHHRMSSAAFAAAIGVSEKAVQKWRRGERTPRPEALSRIAVATNGAVTPNDFVAYGDYAVAEEVVG